MMCPHRKDFPAITHCKLLNAGWPTKIDHCAKCMSQWRDGAPPEPGGVLPPHLVQVSSIGRLRDVVVDGRKPFTVEMSMGDLSPIVGQRSTGRAIPRRDRKPTGCDHSGRRLRKGVNCRTSTYECDLHGEVTCDNCAVCSDFVPITL